MKSLLLPTLLLVGSASAATAQQLPIPGQKNSDWVLKRTENTGGSAVTASPPAPVPMPNAMPAGAGMRDSSGRWLIYYDSPHNLRYNLKSLNKGWVRVQSTQTGTVYTYSAKNPAAIVPPR